MQKRGISGIVATVLIILITVAAVAIIWMVIAPMIKTKTDTAAESSGGILLLIDTTHGYTTYDSVKDVVCVQVKRGNDNFNISGIMFIFSFSGSSQNNITGPAPIKNGETTYCFGGIGVKPSKISIAPIINKNGKDEVQPISSTITGDQIRSGDLSGVPGSQIIHTNFPGVYVCNPSCASPSGVQCGQTIYDANGCSTCLGGTMCSSGVCNATGQCAASCVPMTCANYSGQCGSALPSGCSGGTVNCSNSCGSGQTCNATGWCVGGGVGGSCHGVPICGNMHGSHMDYCIEAGCNYNFCNGSSFDCSVFSNKYDIQGYNLCGAMQPIGCSISSEYCGPHGQNLSCSDLNQMFCGVVPGCHQVCGTLGQTFNCDSLGSNQVACSAGMGCHWNNTISLCQGGTHNCSDIIGGGGACQAVGCTLACGGGTKSCDSVTRQTLGGGNMTAACLGIGCQYNFDCGGGQKTCLSLNDFGVCGLAGTAGAGCNWIGMVCTSTGSEHCSGIPQGDCPNVPGCSWS